MRIDIISIFPEMFDPVLNTGMLRLARERELLDVRLHNLRDATSDKHRQVDDEPYGGGPGMVMTPEPFYQALSGVLGEPPYVLPGGTRTILLSARGTLLRHEMVQALSRAQRLVLLCGRYEGVDARVADFVTDEVSIGDYVLSGGEIGAMVLVDAVGRLMAGVLGAEESLDEESFTAGQLEYPHYTRPALWRGLGVPPVLTSGDHRRIREWRAGEARFSTKVRRPDLTDTSGG
jgi:tRNA (guanine37-N1)-methyltransferase